MNLAPWFAFAGQGFLKGEPPALLEMARELEETGEGAEPWRPLLAAMIEALETSPAEMRREHVRLFLSPEGAPCPPWQSAWDDPPRLMGPSHHAALAWYRRLGVEPQLENEPADHIGLLLAFCARLLDAGRGAGELARYRSEHLAWIPGYAGQLARHARHPFHRALAELCRRLVNNL